MAARYQDGTSEEFFLTVAGHLNDRVQTSRESAAKENRGELRERRLTAPAAYRPSDWASHGQYRDDLGAGLPEEARRTRTLQAHRTRPLPSHRSFSTPTTWINGSAANGEHTTGIVVGAGDRASSSGRTRQPTALPPQPFAPKAGRHVGIRPGYHGYDASLAVAALVAEGGRLIRS